MENNLKKDLKYYLISSAITLVLGIGIFCLFFFVRGKTVGYGLLNWQDSTIIVGIILIGVGAIMGVARDGFFDIFAYGFKQLGGAIFTKKPTEYHDYPGYRETQKIKRKSTPKLFISVLIVGAIFLVVSLCLYLAYLSLR